ncbi:MULTISPECIES: uroporphyrinogen-III C-methyltransferase [unclassified Microbacterium]|uniref:uroporphyrinogen-III C-methyltransferase n=1 Tax=unclassified Microbacterium TaxID=2609290 RepID=UPI000EA88D5C|nr:MULTISPECIES: uroporphyrinogen-III C-methyltransferase [unclassified Microbacterium]MBT2483859.1 uroporphyrinogen-III C-methyltransferase [Microbacterium sp. ISL-108]RKN66841.1 uroporphyrinogen-III C-methyltransferase [Microbacterium sp. CGR2]
MTGTVTLVGAGPGDAGLLTVRGLRALQDADVIVADRLGARAVLDQLAADGVQLSAEVIDVGKLPGHHPVPQDGINALLVQLASAGRRVVRLKGGDPFVYGRGREEQQHCEDAGIPVEVVPGVTSAVSVPAVAGIPLTHRGIAASFTVLSGHDQIDQVPGGSDHTVVLLMGVNTLGHSAHVLSAGARGVDCPVAITEDGYGERERVTIGTLGTIAHLAAGRQVRSPAVVVVGEVVRLSPHAASALSGSAPAADRAPRPHWADALDAGLAVDTGLIQAVDSLSPASARRSPLTSLFSRSR